MFASFPSYSEISTSLVISMFINWLIDEPLLAIGILSSVELSVAQACSRKYREIRF